MDSVHENISVNSSKIYDVADSYAFKISNRVEENLKPQQHPSYVSLIKNDEIYDFTHASRGLAIIINNIRFESSTSQHLRDGSEVDGASLFRTLEKFGFRVKEHQNLTAKEIMDVFALASQEDFSFSDCLFACILTHGEENFIWGTDRPITLSPIFKLFNGESCPSLAGKPKIFLIQACRGSKFDDGVEFARNFDTVDSPTLYSRIPSEADFLFAYSTPMGYYSWRNNQYGSWFIQSICSVLAENGHSMDLLSMLTKASKKVAYFYESNCDSREMSKKKQIPCVVSLLTKHIYFFPKLSFPHPQSPQNLHF